MSQREKTRAKAEALAATVEQAVAASALAIDSRQSLLLVENFATIVPPEGDTHIELLTMSPGGSGGGRSVKPGNITLNMQKLVSAIAAGVLTAVGVVQIPWTGVFGALVIWDSLYSGASVDLSEQDASVMWTLWCHRDEGATVPRDGLLAQVNHERTRYGRSPLTEQQLGDALGNLQRIRAIQPSQHDAGRWWLREWVRVEY